MNAVPGVPRRPVGDPRSCRWLASSAHGWLAYFTGATIGAASEPAAGGISGIGLTGFTLSDGTGLAAAGARCAVRRTGWDRLVAVRLVGVRFTGECRTGFARARVRPWGVRFAVVFLVLDDCTRAVRAGTRRVTLAGAGFGDSAQDVVGANNAAAATVTTSNNDFMGIGTMSSPIRAASTNA